MSKRVREPRHVSTALDRLRTLASVPRRRPRESLVVLRDGLLATVLITLLLRAVLWDPLEAAVADALQSVPGDSPVLLSLTPFDVLVAQTAAGLVVGSLVGAARAWAFYWQRRRRQGPVVEDWTVGSPIAGFLAGALAVFVVTIAGSFLLAVTVLAEPLAAATSPYDGFPNLRAYKTTMLVLVFCLAIGVASVLAYVLAVLASEGVAPLHSVLLGGASAATVAAAYGWLAWSDVPLARPAWTGPLLAGYAVGACLAAVGARRSAGRP